VETPSGIFRILIDLGIERSEHVGGVRAGALRRLSVLRQLRRMRGPVDFLNEFDTPAWPTSIL